MSEIPACFEVFPMKCPKCGYSSFPYLESCQKCGLALTEPQAILGLYALRPDPPDLLLAYQTANQDVTRTTPLPPPSIPSLELDAFDASAPEAAAAQPLALDAEAGGEPVSPAADMLARLGQDLTLTDESPAREPPAAAPDAVETSKPHTLEPSALADTPLTLDDTVDLEDSSAQRAKPPIGAPEEEPVYDLDLDDDSDDLSLLPLEGRSSPGDSADDEEVLEYTLEIEDNLEIEIEGLELEQDDEDEDDDER
jgi:hypothetical protein